MTRENYKIKIIDLFAGAGGFTLGFNDFRNSQGMQVFQSVWANDFNKYASCKKGRQFRK